MARPTSEKLMEAALRLFSERGFHETTVGDIERAAGLTPRAGGFYRHFAAKEEVLLQAVARMSREMIEEIRLPQIVALQSPRAELLMIARALIRHAERYRPTRLILQREAHKFPKLRQAARRANARLAAVDVVPWVTHALERSGRTGDPREIGLLIFGPVLLHILATDRGDAAFGLKGEVFLETWADHWTDWLEAPDAD